MPTPALRDLVGNAPIMQTAHAAMTVVDALQNIPEPGARLLGAASSFVLLSECSGISVPDLMCMAHNAMHAAQVRRPEFAAVADYINNEILAPQ